MYQITLSSPTPKFKLRSDASAYHHNMRSSKSDNPTPSQTMPIVQKSNFEDHRLYFLNYGFRGVQMRIYLLPPIQLRYRRQKGVLSLLGRCL